MFMNTLVKYALLSSTLCLSVVSTNTYAATATCKISRPNTPITWDNRDSTSTRQFSSFSNETCTVPANSIITSVGIGFNAKVGKRAILTNGLPHGEYTLTVSAAGKTAENVAIVSTSKVHAIGGSNRTSVFNGAYVQDTAFTVSAIVKKGRSLSCSNRNPNVCAGYLTASYQINVDYEMMDALPAVPAWISAEVTSETGATLVEWPAIADITHYLVATQFNNNAWTDFTYSATTNSATWSDLNVGKRRYKVKACNASGCSGESIASGWVYVLGTPDTPTASLNSSTIAVNWQSVENATSYAVAIKFNNNAWTSYKYRTANSTISWTGLGSGTRQYRVKACRDGVCFAPSTVSLPLNN